jgi:hypothetical protein
MRRERAGEKHYRRIKNNLKRTKPKIKYYTHKTQKDRQSAT